MEKHQITVIVPCYNVEKYVEKSLKSLLDQTYKNLKIIAIDDCSTDNTYKIIEKIGKENQEKLKVYKNKQNKGAAYTRNRGIELAQTEYIGFIDSDDYIDNNYFEELMKTILEKQADVVITDMQLVNEKGEELAPVQVGINLGIEDIKEATIDNGLAASPCNKLFKKSLIEKYLFPEGKINEDIATVIPTVLHTNKIAYTGKVKYYYVQREKSVQNSEFSERRFDIIDSVELTLDRIKDVQKYEIYSAIILYHQILMVYVYVITALEGFKTRQKYLKMFIQRESNLRVENTGAVPKYLNTRGKLRKNILVYCNKITKTKISNTY